MDTALYTASYSARAAIHHTLQTTPGALALLLNIPVIADLQLLRDKRQMLIDEKLMHANRSRISYDYRPGDEVLLLAYKPDKLDPRATGPYRIEQVHVNGTITIRRSAHVMERINIRRIRPY